MVSARAIYHEIRTNEDKHGRLFAALSSKSILTACEVPPDVDHTMLLERRGIELGRAVCIPRAATA